jgi:predicted nucleic acid-binding protein
MILVDVNLLLYAYNASAPQHAEARRWLEETIVKPEPFGLSWFTLLAFLRISTNPRAFPNPFSIEMDAHLAALAIEYNAVLCTADSDFSRFPELQFLNPLNT